jgi:hypothetical protein
MINCGKLAIIEIGSKSFKRSYCSVYKAPFATWLFQLPTISV